MADEPRQDAVEAEPEPIRHFRGEGWRNIWGFLLLLVLACAGVCLYMIVTVGLWAALESKPFGFAVVIGLILGIWLLGRWTVPYLLTQAESGDTRTKRHARKNLRLPGSF